MTETEFSNEKMRGANQTEEDIIDWFEHKEMMWKDRSIAEKVYSKLFESKKLCDIIRIFYKVFVIDDRAELKEKEFIDLLEMFNIGKATGINTVKYLEDKGLIGIDGAGKDKKYIILKEKHKDMRELIQFVKDADVERENRFRKKHKW